MPDTAPGLESSLADDIARGRQQRVRRRTIAALAVLTLAVVVAILTVVLDWGWTAWIAALAIAAVALTVASLKYGLVLRIATAVTAIALVAAGVLVVRIPPVTTAGWKIGPDARLIAADDKIAVTFDQTTHAVQGRAIADGREVWKNGFGSSDTVRWRQLDSDAVLLYFDSGSSQQDNGAAVISIADGKTRWRLDIDQQVPLTTNDDVVVFTGKEMTTGVDLRTGKKLWSRPGRATAGSGVQSSRNLSLWVSRSDWIAVPGATKTTPVAVLDARTGRLVATVRSDRNDFVIAGKTFVHFDYAKNGLRLANGTPLAGGRAWQAEFQPSRFHEELDVVDGQARALYDNKAVYLDPDTGALREVRLDNRWSPDRLNGGPGGRYIAVKQRDRDRKVVAWAVADTVTGKLVELDGPGHPVEVEIEEFSGDTAISHTTVVDAVGAESSRYARIVDGAEHGQTSTTGARRFESAGDVIQLDDRIIALRKD